MQQKNSAITKNSKQNVSGGNSSFSNSGKENNTTEVTKDVRIRETKTQFPEDPADQTEPDDLLLSRDFVGSDDESDVIEQSTNTQCSVVDSKKNLKDKRNFSKNGQIKLSKPVPADIFAGVERKARFYLSGINEKSTRKVILLYLEKYGVKVTYLKLFKDKHNTAQISAKLNVTEETANIIDTDNFWPTGVMCRRWLSNREWQDKTKKNSTENKCSA